MDLVSDTHAREPSTADRKHKPILHSQHEIQDIIIHASRPFLYGLCYRYRVHPLY
jgi:hypothetical protein